MGKQWTQWQTLFSWAPKSLQMLTAAMKLKDICSLEEKLWPTWTAYWKTETLFCHKGLCSQRYGFSSSHVWMWELDYKDSWALKNWCLQTVVLEKTPESPLESKEIKPVNPKGNQPQIIIGRTDDETEAPMLWPPNVKRQFIGKDPDSRKDWRQGQKGMTENGWMASPIQRALVWQALGDGEGQGSLACCNP